MMATTDIVTKIYQDLFKTYVLKYPEKSAKVCQMECNELWKQKKNELAEVKQMIAKWKVEIEQRRNASKLTYFFSQGTSRPPKPQIVHETLADSVVDVVADVETVSNEQPSLPEGTTQKPVQVKLQNEINCISRTIASLAELKDTRGFSNDELAENRACLMKKAKLEKELKRKRLNAEAAARKRKKQKTEMENLLASNPNLHSAHKKVFRDKVGRPAIEVEQAGLQQAILDLVLSQAYADGRRTETMTVCATLDDLNEALKAKGFNICRTSTYYRLLPAKSNGIDSQRHINTLPIRLKKPENDLRKKHDDSHFALFTVNMLKDLAAFMGGKAVFYLSQDDKCRVPIGIPAATKQGAFMMHIEYRLRLPDHTFVIAERHKLIPSVYACCIVNDKAVTYSGPTYVAIRSAKHSSSTAATHFEDFEKLTEIEEFKVHMFTEDNKLKPILIVSVDGGPDENPRYPKTAAAWAVHFKKYNFDAIFVVTHAPGQSAFNIVERRMAPLSKKLTGVLLPHDFYGTHLDSHGRTVDTELELHNFEKAGVSLAHIWNDTEIDGHLVKASFVSSTASPVDSLIDEKWKFRHMRQSQYLLQIVKCDDRSCCKEFRTNYNIMFPEKFLPGPILHKKTDKGVMPCESAKDVAGKFGSLLIQNRLRPLEKSTSPYKVFPFDQFCPTVNAKINSRICTLCHGYFPTQVAMKAHRKSAACETGAVVIDETDIDLELFGEYEEGVVDDVDNIETVKFVTEERSWSDDEVEF